MNLSHDFSMYTSYFEISRQYFNGRPPRHTCSNAVQDLIDLLSFAVCKCFGFMAR